MRYPISPMESSNSNRKPVKVFKARGITASVFANQSKKGETFHKVCLQRTYWDGKEFQTSDSFGRDEVPIAMLLMLQAFQHQLQIEEAAKKESSDE